MTIILLKSKASHRNEREARGLQNNIQYYIGLSNVGLLALERTTVKYDVDRLSVQSSVPICSSVTFPSKHTYPTWYFTLFSLLHLMRGLG
jgi:hypothetical protein